EHRGTPLWFERSFAFALGPHLLRGRVDRVDRLADGSCELIDYKTGHPRSAAQLADDVQLALYAMAAQRAWGVAVGKLSYYYVLDNLKVSLAEDHVSASEARLTQTIDTVARGILDLRFEPRPSYSVCASCDFLNACPAAET
ncbi:MAG: PD-(D/E)XK nuclease family protein, partial [Acidobacteriota bacterium]|nr:PD-(D/E)XK nuclease family protein [Acidobacteriota bacterium]